MTVSELMSAPVATCRHETGLTAAAQLMRDHGCGFMPVLDAQQYVAGVVTDRDLVIALAGSGTAPASITVGRAMTAPAHTCLPGDSVGDALRMMQRFHVRRVPVVDRAGRLLGVLSLDDIARAAGRPGLPAPDVIVEALAGICAPRSRRLVEW
jgi:CBS domain-containing protein